MTGLHLGLQAGSFWTPHLQWLRKLHLGLHRGGGPFLDTASAVAPVSGRPGFPFAWSPSAVVVRKSSKSTSRSCIRRGTCCLLMRAILFKASARGQTPLLSRSRSALVQRNPKPMPISAKVRWHVNLSKAQ